MVSADFAVVHTTTTTGGSRTGQSWSARGVRKEAIFQVTFAGLHSYAALLALVAAILHAGAATYHLRRWRYL